MADRKISDLTALTAPASGDYLPIVDISEAAAANKNKRITIEELFRGVPLGTAAAPSIAIEGDENTGIYSPGADQLAISTNGTGRLFINSAGDIGIGWASPSYDLHLEKDENALTTSYFRNINTGSSAGSRLIAASLVGNLTFTAYSAAHSVWPATTVINSDSGFTGGMAINTAGANPLRLFTDSTERLRITSTGTVNIVGAGTAGSTQAISFNGSAPVNSLVVDSLGRVGIGNSAPGSLLDVGSGSAAGVTQFTLKGGSTGGDYGIFSIQNGSTPRGRLVADAAIDALRIDTAASANGKIQFYTGASYGHAVTIDSSQRVGIGSTSPTQKFQVTDGTLSNFYVAPGYNSGQGTTLAVGGGEYIEFATNGITNPRARIDSSGRLLVGTSSGPLINESQIGATGSGNTACLKTTVAGNNPLLLWNSATSGDNIFCSFFTESAYTARGTIDYNRGAGQVRYNTTSDRRLKSDITPASTALSKLSEIKVRSYKWTETNYLVEYGFIAQELNAVLPDAVKQGDDEDEVVDAWAVDNSKLVPVITKALQEAMERIEQLEAKVAALESA